MNKGMEGSMSGHLPRLNPAVSCQLFIKLDDGTQESNGQGQCSFSARKPAVCGLNERIKIPDVKCSLLITKLRQLNILKM